MDISLRWDKTRSGHLCRSCKYAHIRRSGEQVLTVCQQINRPYDLVRRPVEACSDYYPQDATPLATMQQMAWTISTDEKKKVGFKPPVKKPDDWLQDRRD